MDASMELDDLHDAIDMERLRPVYLYRLSILLTTGFSLPFGSLLVPGSGMICAIAGAILVLYPCSVFLSFLWPRVHSDHVATGSLVFNLKSSFWYGTLDGVDVLHRLRYPSYGADYE